MATTPTPYFMLFYVSDLEESLAYFTQTLGLEHDPKQDAPDFRGFVHHPGFIAYGLALVSEGNSPEARVPGNVEVYFKTDDLEGMHASLAGKGVPITAMAQRPFGTIFSIPAPDGHLITMIRPASHH